MLMVTGPAALIEPYGLGEPEPPGGGSHIPFAWGLRKLQLTL